MSEAPLPAARWEDLIAHNQSQLMRLLGEIAGGLGTAWAAARILRVAVALNPAGLAFLGASFLLEYFITKAIDYGADKLGEAMAEPGIMGIKMGSNNVSMNRRPAARGGPQGDPVKCHDGKKIIEGSRWVSINEKPAARVSDWTNHSSKVATGSPNVFIGGPKVDADRQSELQSFIGYGFAAVNLASAYRKGWGAVGAAIGQEAANRTRDAALDAAWDFIRQ